jgi:glycosyltransferase involved in cell wall biosynthesis
MKTILHIVNSLSIGGAEILLKNTANELADYNNIVVHLCMPDDMKSQIRADKIICLGYTGWKSLFSTSIKLKKIIKENNVNIVHSHLYESTIIARLAVPKNVKLVSTYHTDIYDPHSLDYSKKRLWFDKITYHKKYVTICVSPLIQPSLEKNIGITKNCFILANFAAPDFTYKYTFSNSNTLKLISVGNLRRQKNYFLAIEALAMANNPNISLDIYGDGILHDELSEFIKEKKVMVALKGSAKMSSEILNNYDAFLMTSYLEGMPIALIESMVTGLPSILNDLPELRETAKDCALFFEKDSAEALTILLKKCLENKSLLLDLANNTLVHGKDFHAQTYISKLKHIYEL